MKEKGEKNTSLSLRYFLGVSHTTSYIQLGSIYITTYSYRGDLEIQSVIWKEYAQPTLGSFTTGEILGFEFW